MNKREIRFRAWDKERQRMYFPDEMYMWKGIITPKGFQEGVLGNENKYEIMQWTGLKDKNGKEIYEGDWVKANDGIGKVIFLYGAFVMDCGEKNVYIFDQLGRGETKFEVIGNIFKDSKLLK